VDALASSSTAEHGLFRRIRGCPMEPCSGTQWAFAVTPWRSGAPNSGPFVCVAVLTKLIAHANPLVASRSCICARDALPVLFLHDHHDLRRFGVSMAILAALFRRRKLLGLRAQPSSLIPLKARSTSLSVTV